jgi:hypothetical protein
MRKDYVLRDRFGAVVHEHQPEPEPRLAEWAQVLWCLPIAWAIGALIGWACS